MSWRTSLECCLDSSEVSGACQFRSLEGSRSERRTGVVEVGLVASDDVSWVGRHVDGCGEGFVVVDWKCVVEVVKMAELVS